MNLNRTPAYEKRKRLVKNSFNFVTQETPPKETFIFRGRKKPQVDNHN